MSTERLPSASVSSLERGRLVQRTSATKKGVKRSFTPARLPRGCEKPGVKLSCGAGQPAIPPPVSRVVKKLRSQPLEATGSLRIEPGERVQPSPVSGPEVDVSRVIKLRRGLTRSISGQVATSVCTMKVARVKVAWDAPTIPGRVGHIPACLVMKMDGYMHMFLRLRLERDVFAADERSAYCSFWGSGTAPWSTFTGLYYTDYDHLDVVWPLLKKWRVRGLFVVPIPTGVEATSPALVEMRSSGYPC